MKEKRAKRNGPTDGALKEELRYRRESIAAHRVRAREEQREREREQRRKALDDEASFWSETAAVLGEDASLRAALGEVEAAEQAEAAAGDWATWRAEQLDPSGDEFWDASVEIGNRRALDPAGDIEQIIADDNRAIRRRKQIADGDVDLWGEGE